LERTVPSLFTGAGAVRPSDVLFLVAALRGPFDDFTADFAADFTMAFCDWRSAVRV
jgi:hypothetical protein